MSSKPVIDSAAGTSSWRARGGDDRQAHGVVDGDDGGEPAPTESLHDGRGDVVGVDG